MLKVICECRQEWLLQLIALAPSPSCSADIGKDMCERAAHGDEEAVRDLMGQAVHFVVQSDRGDVFDPALERCMASVLPSFLESVRSLGYDALPFDRKRDRMPPLEMKLRWELGEHVDWAIQL